MDPEYRAKGYRLVAAAAKGETGLLQQMLKEGADVHFERDLPLRSAALTGRMDSLELLVAAGADVSAACHEALFCAAKAGDREMVDFLLGHGGDPDVVMAFHSANLDTAARDCLQERMAKGDFIEAKENQGVINDLAESAPRLRGHFRLRPPSP